MNIKEELFKLQDEKFGDFNSRLIPGVDRKKVIGVKTPELKKFAKIILRKYDDCMVFCNSTCKTV